MSKRLVEIFGHAPTDYTPTARQFWTLKACPFIGKSCTKFDHTRTICYGTCSVGSPTNEVIICPNRLYADNYATIKKVSTDVFGEVQFMLFDEYIRTFQKLTGPVIVALGQNSGKEVKINKSMSMDWVLAKIDNKKLVEYVGLEVQSIDITGNYRDAFHASKAMDSIIPRSGHGLNWANVHKRLIPQIIRKGMIYSRSNLVKHGLYFVVPDAVYQKFEELIGADITPVLKANPQTITVHAYELGALKPPGQKRDLILKRQLRFDLGDFSQRFINGPNLPSATLLDAKISDILGL